MDVLRNQVEVLTNEITTLKAELINVKGTHANLHQQTVEANSATARKFFRTKDQSRCVGDSGQCYVKWGRGQKHHRIRGQRPQTIDQARASGGQ